MSNHIISRISPSDRRRNHQLNDLLRAEGIRRDNHLDYTCAMYDDNQNIIATGSCFGNTLRCIAVSSAHQGEGLLNELITHLTQVQFARGNTHIFLYTKCNSARFFQDLGFYEIARIENQIVFMENRRTGFSNYLNTLSQQNIQIPEAAQTLHTAQIPQAAQISQMTQTLPLQIAAIVMNANPFTLGHQYLVEKAAAENDVLHLFIVSEDASLVPFSIRKRLVVEGTSHLTNICYHDCGPYLISSSTFPSYFQKDEIAAIESHARLDLTIFTRIAEVLNIRRRYVGEESDSMVTGIYNEIMQQKLPENKINCIVVPRKQANGERISASTVRQYLKNGNFNALRALLPETTLNYFLSEEAAPVIERIQSESNVIHY